jgi:hypothetical protein
MAPYPIVADATMIIIARRAGRLTGTHNLPVPEGVAEESPRFFIFIALPQAPA